MSAMVFTMEDREGWEQRTADLLPGAEPGGWAGERAKERTRAMGTTKTMGGREVLISREIDALRERVFRAWGDSAQLARWYAPVGCTTSLCTVDFRVGGKLHDGIRTREGYDCGCTGEYLEIVAPEKIVFTLPRADENGNAVEPAAVGMDPAWPTETVVTVTLAEVGKKALLTLHQTVPEALAKKTGAYPSWLEILDKLEREVKAG